MASNMPIAQPDPLSQLRDIHLPDPIGWWPLAPGWYLLTLFFVLGVIALVYFIRHYYLKGRIKRKALRLLTDYQQEYQSDMNSQVSSAHLSYLLKQVALAYFPRKTVASLQGPAWILFLNESAKGLNFEEVQAELLEMPYQPAKDCDLGLLFDMTRSWIRQRRTPCLN